MLTGDVADYGLAQRAVDLAVRSFGKLDGLVLNHGTLGQVGKVAENDPELWKVGFDVNFISLIAFVCSHRDGTDNNGKLLVLIRAFVLLSPG